LNIAVDRALSHIPLKLKHKMSVYDKIQENGRRRKNIRQS